MQYYSPIFAVLDTRCQKIGSDEDKYVCSDYGTIFKNQKRLHNHKRKPQTFDYPKCGNTFGDHGNKKRSLEICKEPEIGFDP